MLSGLSCLAAQVLCFTVLLRRRPASQSCCAGFLLHSLAAEASCFTVLLAQVFCFTVLLRRRSALQSCCAGFLLHSLAAEVSCFTVRVACVSYMSCITCVYLNTSLLVLKYIRICIQPDNIKCSMFASLATRLDIITNATMAHPPFLVGSLGFMPVPSGTSP